MKLSELFEMWNKSYTDKIVWRNYRTSKGYCGMFKFEGKMFVIDIVLQKLQDLKQMLDIERIYDIPDSIFENKTFARIDYCQFIDGRKIYTDTGNLGDNAKKIISTVTVECSEKLKDLDINVVYFAAKSHEDGSENKRKRIYPQIGRTVARRLGYTCLIDIAAETITTFLVRGFTFEETCLFMEKMQ